MSSEGEDVLLSEARIVSDAHVPWEPSERPFSTGGFDPRTAIFRAREAYRDRQRAKAAADRQLAGTRAEDAEGLVEEVSVSEPEELPGSASDLDSVVGLTAPDAAERPDPFTAHDQLQGDSPGNQRAQLRKDVLLGSELVESQPEEPSQSRPTDEPKVVDPALEKSFLLALIDGDANVPSIEEEEREEIRNRFRNGNAEDGEPLPDWFRRDLPRVCRSCRDYRPSADGQRGWCANAWAFTHRRLVHEDDEAPCQSTIGDWWIPVDDVWLVAADVSSHGRATPLLDRLSGKADVQRRRS